MGLRVNKMVGYGLTDVRVVDGELGDDRLNANSPLLAGDPELRRARWS